MKNSVDWELVRGDVKGFDWNEIVRFPCPVSSVSEAMLLVLRDRVSKRMIWSEQAISLGLMIGLSWLTVRSKECRVAVGRKVIGRSIG